MNRVWTRYALCAALAVWMIWASASNLAGAQGANQAGLVIRYGDGSVSTHCVRFDEAEISGFDLLLGSGLDVVYSSSGIGSMICKIGGEGCDNPGNCLCQCRGANCMYWSYWRQVDGAWQYSSVGASLSRVKPGAVDGWTWGAGTIDAAPQPPLISLEEICLGLRPSLAAPTPTATPTPAPPTPTTAPTQTAEPTRTPLPVTSTAAAAPSPSPPATPTVSPASMPTALPMPTSTATSLPEPAPTQTAAATPPARSPAGRSPAAEYWGFGALLVLLLGAGWLALRRRAA